MLRDIIRTIEQEISPVGQEIIPCRKTLGRVPARAAKAGRDLPPFDISALDGFACGGAGREFTVKGSLGPGEKLPSRLKNGEALFVATGAAIPPYSRFVPVEQVTQNGTRILTETSDDMRKIWKRGYWITKATEVTRKGKEITPRTMELLALAGLKSIAVFRRPGVSILSTGNELKKGVVPNSNHYLLAGLVERDGGEIMRLATAADEVAEIRGALTKMAAADLLLVTGGTAMGEKDLTRASLQECGATFLLERLPIVPGKTMTFGKLGRTPFFILPGNPRALRTLYEVFIKPCLRILGGRTDAVRWSKASAPQDIEKETGRIHLIPVAFSAAGVPHIRELYTDEPDGFIILERDVKRVRAGKEVEIQWTEA